MPFLLLDVKKIHPGNSRPLARYPVLYSALHVNNIMAFYETD